MELTNTNCLKDPTCAIFLKSMGIKDIKYEGHEGHKGHEGHHVLYFLNAAGSRISNMTFPCVMKLIKPHLHLHLSYILHLSNFCGPNQCYIFKMHTFTFTFTN